MHQQRMVRHLRHSEPPDRRSSQYQPFGVQPLRSARLHITAERKAGQDQRQVAEFMLSIVRHRHGVFDLAIAAFITGEVPVGEYQARDLVRALDALKRAGFWVAALDAHAQARALVAQALQAAVVYVPALQALFRTQALSAGEVGLCIALSGVVFCAVEAEKLWRRRIMRRTPPHAAP